jgi:adenylate cyclase
LTLKTFCAVIDLNVSSKRALLCALDILVVDEHGINAIFKQYDLPEMHIKIGIDSGENPIIEYGSSGTKSHIDILGYPITMLPKSHR